MPDLMLMFLIQHISPNNQDKLDKDIQDFCAQLTEKEREIVSANDQEMAKLKVEIQDIRGARAKMRSIASSVSSGITIFPPGTPRSSPEDNEVVEGGEHPQKMDGGEEVEQHLGIEKNGDQLLSPRQEDTQLKLPSEQETDCVKS